MFYFDPMYMLFALPGLLLATLWLFPTYIAVERGTGVMDSLSASSELVRVPGRFWLNFVLVLVSFGTVALADSIPYVGGLLALIIAPAIWIMVTIAYLQQTRAATSPAAMLPSPA